MLKFSNTLKRTALAGVLGVAAVVGVAGAASARDYTRCDADGGRCYRVHCDWDGDNCYRESSYNNYYNRDYYHRYDRGYYGGYYGGYHDRRYVCDSDGDRCHWTNY
jgi:hypothetical protein